MITTYRIAAGLMLGSSRLAEYLASRSLTLGLPLILGTAVGFVTAAVVVELWSDELMSDCDEADDIVPAPVCKQGR